MTLHLFEFSVLFYLALCYNDYPAKLMEHSTQSKNTITITTKVLRVGDVRYHMVGLCPTVLTNVIITPLNILFDPILFCRNVASIHRQISPKLDFFKKCFTNMFNFSQLIISSKVIIKS